jgi:hypothetical protein
MAKKTPTMLKRLKKKLKKEDITKYGTPEEIKLLEGSDPFEIPVGDEQDQSLPEEEISLEDEQEAGEKPSEDYESEYGIGTITVPEDLMERLYVYITDDESEPDEREELMMELEHLLGDGAIDEEEPDESRTQKPWQKY